MTMTGWLQETLWLVGNRLPMGDPHDGQGHRPQIRAAFGPQGQNGLVISDEQQNVYFAAMQGSRFTQRTWLKLADDCKTQGKAIGCGGGDSAGSFRYTALYYPNAGYDNVTLEGTTLEGDSVSAAAIESHLVQSHFAKGQVVLHERSASAASLTFCTQPRLLVNAHGVPEVIHWRRDASADLLLAMPDGTIRRWEGLADSSLSPLPGQGEPVLAGERPIAFDGMVHLSVVDWNLRGKSDLLVATEDGELWLFYDVGNHQQVAYDHGRQLCDAQGPIELFGAASATVLRYGQNRLLVAADGQGQLWQWTLDMISSWVVSDWSQAAHVATNSRRVASTYEPGHWWVQHDDANTSGSPAASPSASPSASPFASRGVLRLGPPVVDQVISGEQPLAFAPLPAELTIPSPCTGPCEIHVRLASLEPILKHVAIKDGELHKEHLLPLDSMVDVRVGGQIHPQMVSAGRLADGATQEIYWGTADLTDKPVCLQGLHGGFLFDGGLPCAVVSVRIVPLTPQSAAQIITHLGSDAPAVTAADDSQKNSPEANTTHAKADGASAGKIILQDTPPANTPANALSNASSIAQAKATSQAQDAAATSTTQDQDADEFDDDMYEEGEELLDVQGTRPTGDAVALAGMVESFGWTNTIRADSAQELDELVARHHDAGMSRLYWRVGAGPWEYPSRVHGAQNTIPVGCSAGHESLAQRQADLFEHVNRLELANAAAKRREMTLFAWLGLHHQSDHLPPGQFESIDQFLLDHPQYAEKDVHGQPCQGKLCLGYAPVREFFINIVLETMEMGVDGVLLDMSDHLPRVQYGDPIVTEFNERHHCDMRQLSPFDLRVVEMQSLVLTRFVRELRDVVHHARPRKRLPIHVRVTRPHVLMGSDPAAWAREHLIDAIIIDTPNTSSTAMASRAAAISEHTQSLAAMAHIVKDTGCQIAAAVDVDPADNQNLQSHRLANRIQHKVSQGASFVVLQDTAAIIRRRDVCLTLRRINQPDEHQPRAVLG